MVTVGRNPNSFWIPAHNTAAGHVLQKVNESITGCRVRVNPGLSITGFQYERHLQEINSKLEENLAENIP